MSFVKPRAFYRFSGPAMQSRMEEKMVCNSYRIAATVTAISPAE
jgi:hypothetical protein